MGVIPAHALIRGYLRPEERSVEYSLPVSVEERVVMHARSRGTAAAGQNETDAPETSRAVSHLLHPMTAPPLPVYPNLWAEEIPDVRAVEWASAKACPFGWVADGAAKPYAGEHKFGAHGSFFRLTLELSDHGQCQDDPAFRRNVHRCPWFAPVTFVRPWHCHASLI